MQMKRNDLCDCESGLKFKKCCYLIGSTGETPYSSGYCCVTRIQTSNKWKSNLIHPMIMEIANIVRDENGYMMREAIQVIQNRYSHFLVGKKPKNPKQLSLIVRNFIKDVRDNPKTLENIGGYRA